MPRGDEFNESLRFSDRDDDADDLGYGGGGGGGSSYDDDDEEDGGWTTHKDDSDDLWDSTDDSDDDEEEGLGTPVVDADEDDEESPLVVARAPKSGGSPVVMTGRYTDIAERRGGRWVYVVDHASAEPAGTEGSKK